MTVRVVRREAVRRAADELPDPDLHGAELFETRAIEPGETSPQPISFTRTATSGKIRRSLWVFEGLLNVEAFEQKNFAAIDKHYQRPKAEKHDLSEWLRAELGPRCEMIQVANYDTTEHGQRVRAYFR
ncbi:MAG TPA: hypothetical protein VJT73_17945 [Polyangiaceae bacterium]|nr:hypothetical protein [Polyangiaceae bacterium]